MRFFGLLNLQHVALFVFPTVVLMILFAVGLKFVLLRRRKPDDRLKEVRHVFPGDLREGDGPMPLVLVLIIAGFVLWALAYALLNALKGGPI